MAYNNEKITFIDQEQFDRIMRAILTKVKLTFAKQNHVHDAESIDGLEAYVNELLAGVGGTSHTHGNYTLLETIKQEHLDKWDAAIQAADIEKILYENDNLADVDNAKAALDALLVKILENVDNINELSASQTELEGKINDNKALIAGINDPVDGLLAQAKEYSDGKVHIDVRLVDSLPVITDENDPEIKNIHFLKSSDADGNDTYIPYMYVDFGWRVMGGGSAGGGGGNADLTNYYTMAQVNQFLANKVDVVADHSLVADNKIELIDHENRDILDAIDQVKVNEWDNAIQPGEVANLKYQCETAHNFTGNNVKAALDVLFQHEENSYDKTEIDEMFANVQDDLNSRATESFVINKIAEAQMGGGNGEVNLDGLVTDDELNDAINAINTTMSRKVDKIPGSSLVPDIKIDQIHEHDNKAALDEFAEGDKAKLERAIQPGQANLLTYANTVTPEAANVKLALDDLYGKVSNQDALTELEEKVATNETNISEQIAKIKTNTNDIAALKTDKHNHANKEVLDNLNQEVINYAHQHGNAAVLNGIQQANINEWNNAILPAEIANLQYTNDQLKDGEGNSPVNAKAALDAIVNSLGTLNGQHTTMNDNIANNTTAIDAINNPGTGILQKAKDYVDGKLSGKVSVVVIPDGYDNIEGYFNSDGNLNPGLKPEEGVTYYFKANGSSNYEQYLYLGTGIDGTLGANDFKNVGGAVDLSGYYKKGEVDQKDAILDAKIAANATKIGELEAKDVELQEAINLKASKSDLANEKAALQANIDKKVDKVDGKSLVDDAKIEQIHAHGNKAVLNGITAEKIAKWDKAEENVQADWDAAEDSDAYIANKPTIPSIEGLLKKTEADATYATIIQHKANADAIDAINHADTGILAQANAALNTHANKVANGSTAGHMSADMFTKLEGLKNYDGNPDVIIQDEDHRFVNDSQIAKINQAHEHANITVLNGITADVKQGYDQTVLDLDALEEALKTVAKTGNYNDLINKPTKLSQFTNDVPFLMINSTSVIKDTNGALEVVASGAVTNQKTQIPIDSPILTNSGQTFSVGEKVNVISSIRNVDLEGYATDDELANKVDKVAGKGLSTNDLTNELVNKINAAEANIQADWHESDSSSDAFIKNKPDMNQYYTKTQVDDFTGGKKQRFVTQAQYDDLRLEDKNDPNYVWNITDAVIEQHTHANKPLLDQITLITVSDIDTAFTNAGL